MIHAAICGSVMILFITLIRILFLKRLPKQCFRLLWLLAALRLIIPFSYTLEVEVEREVVDTPHEVIVSTYDAVMVDVPTEQAAFDAMKVIRLVIPIGTLISGGFLTIAYIRMRRVAKDAEIIVDDTRGGVSIRAGDGASSPFSCGILPPIIFIPRRMLDFGGERLDCIIAHERQHIKSGDQLVKWLIAAAVCMNWYNPLVWLMWRLANRDIELACDEAVVRHGKNNADYALTLIEAEEARSTATVCSFGAPAMNERIECIMKSKKLTVCGFITAALILAAMSAFFVQVTAAQSDDKADDTTGQTAAPVIPDDTGVSDIKYKLYVNGEEFEGDVLVMPVPEDKVGTFTLSCPLIEYNAVTGHFGEYTTPIGTTYFNSGVNVAAEKGTAVYAAAPGTVTIVEYNYELGNYIMIDHENGCQTVYRHLDTTVAAVGDEVEVGEQIGTVGATGSVTGPNLGFAIIKDGAYVSPEGLFE